MHARLVSGNAVTLIESGVQYFPALQAAIAAARYEVHLESYIFANDATGQSIAAALILAAARGVTVRLMVDGFGSSDFAETLAPRLVASGVEVRIYRQERDRFKLRRHRFRRLHRKIAVIDGRIAFVGGINIIDESDPAQRSHARHDYAVRIEGPLVPRIHENVRQLWQLVTWATFRRRPPRIAPLPVTTGKAGDVRMAFLVRDNFRHRHDIENAYIAAIRRAQHRVVLAHAYFLPGRRLRRALLDAVKRGVRVTLLLQGTVEYLLQHLATQSLYGEFISQGVEIYEYRLSFLHAKVAIVDDNWATVGSSNVDPFSLFLAREANVLIRDEPFTAALHARLEQAMTKGAQRLGPGAWVNMPYWKKVVCYLAYRLVSLLVGLVGYGQQH